MKTKKLLIPFNNAINQPSDSVEDISCFNRIKINARFASVTSALGAIFAHNLYSRFVNHPSVKKSGLAKLPAVRASYNYLVALGLVLGAFIGLLAKLMPKKYPNFFSQSPKTLTMRKSIDTHSHSGLTRRDQFKIELAKLKRQPRRA